MHLSRKRQVVSLLPNSDAGGLVDQAPSGYAEPNHSSLVMSSAIIAVVPFSLKHLLGVPSLALADAAAVAVDVARIPQLSLI